MNLLSRYTKTILILSLLFSANEFYAQQGSITINQAPELETLLALKKEMNGSDSDSNRYKIQIFSGDRTGAEKAKSNFEAKFEKIPSLLEKIKKEFNDAFRFKPKKKDKK